MSQPEQDKHPVGNGIIIAVVGGLILLLLTRYISFLESFAQAVYTKAVNFLKLLWQHLISTVSIPWWLLYIFIILVLFTVWKIIKFLITQRREGPRLEDYREDRFGNVIWKWSNFFGTQAVGLEGFCLYCQTRLIYKQNIAPFLQSTTTLLCERCGQDLVTLNGDLEFALGTIKRQIERRINTGEWKSLVEKTD